MTPPLSARAILPDIVAPAYRPEDYGTGIVHLGLGAFHKAHQAAYTDAALAATGGDWRILGVSLRSAEPAQPLCPQDGRYTLIERGASGDRARVIGAIAGAVCAAGAPGPVLAAMADPACRIISLTVTEKAYGLDRATGGVRSGASCGPVRSGNARPAAGRAWTARPRAGLAPCRRGSALHRALLRQPSA